MDGVKHGALRDVVLGTLSEDGLREVLKCMSGGRETVLQPSPREGDKWLCSIAHENGRHWLDLGISEADLRLRAEEFYSRHLGMALVQLNKAAENAK